MQRVYLDHNSTTRPHESVRRAMAEALDVAFGNPSSPHGPGRAARQLVERARAQVARLLGGAGSSDHEGGGTPVKPSVDPGEIVFVSGGTESDNLAIRGAARAMRARTGRRVIVSSPLEHPAVRGTLAGLVAEGFTSRLVRPAADGTIAPDEVAALLDDDVALCSFALVNHELGTIHPIAELARLAHAAGALLHTDAVQAAGKLPIDVRALGVDLLSISSHKIHGPKGVGALWQRRGLDVEPLLTGGHQERERRPGTENVPGIVGFGAACELAWRELLPRAPEVARLRDRLEQAALAIAGARRFGAALPRAPGTASLGFAGVEGELLMMSLDLEGVAVSTGAACSSGSLDPSPVILALGVPRAEATTAVRFSLGADNTEQEIDAVCALLPSLVARIRESAGPSVAR